MRTPPDVLDEAYERIAQSGFETRRGFLNHGPMACEALVALDRAGDVETWARRFARDEGSPPIVVRRGARDVIPSLGDSEKLPEWIGFFESAIEEVGWPAMVAEWVPRLAPGLASVLFHGVIRVAHATRAINASDTTARRAELARSFGYWAARWHKGAEPHEEEMRVIESGNPPADTLLKAAIGAAGSFVDAPDIVRLHGVTGAMAVSLLFDHIPLATQAAALAQVRAEHVAIYGPSYATFANEGFKTIPSHVRGDGVFVIDAAVASFDPHQVKLVEACRRGFEASEHPIFQTASLVVTGLG